MSRIEMDEMARELLAAEFEAASLFMEAKNVRKHGAYKLSVAAIKKALSASFAEGVEAASGVIRGMEPARRRWVNREQTLAAIRSLSGDAQ
jgi:hypothetical protein